MNDQPSPNTDRELYREPKGDLPSDYYAPSIHVTQDGLIGINVGGTVLTMPIREWFERATPPRVLEPPTEPGHVEFEIEVVPHDWPNDGMGWHKGRDTPDRVASILRHYADQVESFTPPSPKPQRLSEYTKARLMAEKYARAKSESDCPGCGNPMGEHPAGPPCPPPSPPGQSWA